MKVLGIDTSTRCESIGLIDGQEVLADYLCNLPVTHSERLLSSIAFVLRETRTPLEEIDAWAISLGPGSFTGLRIGVATIKGLAYATRKPVIGISSLEVLAAPLVPTPYLICPILDARKGEVYTAFFRCEETKGLRRCTEFRALPPEDLTQEIHEKVILVGDGVFTYGDRLKESLPSFALFPDPSLHHPRGSVVARLGSQLLSQGLRLPLETFTPIYVRPSEAEIKWEAKHPI
ncbi:MAG: tRNA (adenosine(37)-N6)-threonylcarbamoyltransferase complex dimerization subunit type 1 TsaB [Desulfobacterota bacterium]|nr:tRNA (adenosine(37)-N6)-threonylcarbamoyltransferase complex dimerization subunit type 1 TsaB [Thermodesulfobacteriota bacterium]